MAAKQEVEIAEKRILGGRGWCKQGIHYWQRKDYEVLGEVQIPGKFSMQNPGNQPFRLV